ncbi:MAG: hypothetical protein LUE96_11565 [Lachnospiraceae bacterium]|nr:hypothetical protein [Lachnospiraceae bacterium]
MIRGIVKKYKGFTCAAALEIAFICLLAAASFGKAEEITLDADNLIICDDSVTVDEYREVDSLQISEDTLVVYDNKSKGGSGKSLYASAQNDTEPFARYIAESGKLTAAPGVYELEVQYYSLMRDNENSADCDDSTASIQLVSDNNQEKIYYNAVVLRDSLTVNSSRVWIRSLGSIDDLEIKVYFFGAGSVRVDSITLKELPLWRILKIALWVLVFAGIDFLYLYLFTDNHHKKKNIVLLLTAATLFASLPLAADYLLRGHDMDFHVARIWALADNIKAGQWLFPIQTGMLNGYGYAAPIFYGQIFLTLPAVLYNLGAPLQVCYQLYVFAVNIATVLISYFCFKGITKDDKAAALGSFLYSLSAYRIANIYLRAALGEYTAMIFHPLIICGFIRIYQKEASKINWKDCVLVVLGITGVMQSHVLSLEIAMIFMALLSLICLKRTLEPRRLAALVMTVFATMALCASFLLPFLSSMSMDIHVNEGEAGKIQQQGTYLLQVLGVFMTSGGSSVSGMTGEMPLALGFSLVLGVLLFLWCCTKKYEWGIQKDAQMKTGTICTAFTIICIVLSARFFPWDSLEAVSTTADRLVSVVQFPWRYLSVATAFAATASVIAAAVLNTHKGEAALYRVGAVLIAFTLVCIGSFYTDFSNSVSAYEVYGEADAEKNDVVSGEYLPAGTIKESLSRRSVLADFESIEVSDYESDHGKTVFHCRNTSDEDRLVQIPILNYDNYHAYTDDGTELKIKNGDNNRVAIKVPAKYDDCISVVYEVPVLWKTAYALSAATLLAIIALAVYDYIRAKRNNINKNHA